MVNNKLNHCLRLLIYPNLGANFPQILTPANGVVIWLDVMQVLSVDPIVMADTNLVITLLSLRVIKLNQYFLPLPSHNVMNRQVIGLVFFPFTCNLLAVYLQFTDSVNQPFPPVRQDVPSYRSCSVCSNTCQSHPLWHLCWFASIAWHAAICMK